MRLLTAWAREAARVATEGPLRRLGSVILALFCLSCSHQQAGRPADPAGSPAGHGARVNITSCEREIPVHLSRLGAPTQIVFPAKLSLGGHHRLSPVDWTGRGNFLVLWAREDLPSEGYPLVALLVDGRRFVLRCTTSADLFVRDAVVKIEAADCPVPPSE